MKIIVTAGLGIILLLVALPGASGGGPLPSPYDTEPFDTDTIGISGANHSGFFRRDGATDLRYFIGPDCSLFLDFAMPFTDGPGNDFAILTSSQGWEPVGGAKLVRFDFFLDGNLQNSFTTSLFPDQLAEFDLPGNGLVANRIVLTSLSADSCTTLDDAGVAYVIRTPPSITTPPLTQTAEMGSLAVFWVEVTNALPGTTYQWCFNVTNALGGTNSYLDLTNVQPAQAGAYTVVVTDIYGAVTSAPALLSVIPPVERRIVPALNLTGDVGSFLHLDYVNAFGPGAPWLSLTNFTLLSTQQLCLDLSEPLPAQRFYRAWQTNVPTARSVLDPRLATEIPLTGAIGSAVRVDYINQFGPTDAWVTLETVTLTNTTELYFDLTAFRQPTRLYRLVASP
jgi:hypothetical protein